MLNAVPRILSINLTQISVYLICAERVIFLDNGQNNLCSNKTLIFKHIESKKITKFKIGANKSLPLVYLEVVKAGKKRFLVQNSTTLAPKKLK
jgi:hypothetical protein